MKSLIFIEYLYQHGAISLEKMCKYVEDGDISEKDFYDITRLHYRVIKERGGRFKDDLDQI